MLSMAGASAGVGGAARGGRVAGTGDDASRAGATGAGVAGGGMAGGGMAGDASVRRRREWFGRSGMTAPLILALKLLSHMGRPIRFRAEEDIHRVIPYSPPCDQSRIHYLPRRAGHAI